MLAQSEADTPVIRERLLRFLREKMTTPDYTVVYEHDKAMRLKILYRDVSGQNKKLGEYSYSALGQRTGYTRYDTSENVVVHTEYDYLSQIGWLMKLENRKQIGNPGTNVISSFKYYDSSQGDGHDCVGNRKYMELASGDYLVYTYDKRYQLETEIRYNSSVVQQYKYEWSYDDTGNREWQKKWTSASTWDHYREYTYNDMNQLTDEDQWDTASKGTWETHTDFVYSGAGNMTDKDVDDKTQANNDEAWDYHYTYRNRQDWVKKDSSYVGEYEFNVLGNRVKKTASSVTTKMYFNSADCVGDYNGTTTTNTDFIKFDITRQKETIGWEWMAGVRSPMIVTGLVPSSWPTGDEEPNDDYEQEDEDNNPTKNRIYSLDFVGYTSDQASIDRGVLRMNAFEFVRVILNGGTFINQNWLVEGSRCSEKVAWRSRMDVVLDATTGKWKRNAAGENEIVEGHKELGGPP